MTRDSLISPNRFALYILTDANNFTTACAATREALFAEAARVPLLAPITITHWLRTSRDWKKASEWLWNGGLTVGA